MKINYDEKADALYFKLMDSSIIESEEIASGIVYDLDENDNLVGIEILNFNTRNPEELKAIDFIFYRD